MLTADGIDSGHTDFELAKLPDHVDDLKFLAGYGMVQVGSREQEEASIRATRVMVDLYEALDGSGYSDHEASILLIRTLFCLYGDDAGLWERDLFAEFLDARTREDGSDLGAQLALLYQTLNTPADQRQTPLDEPISRFPYVNGGIFAEHLNIPSFSSAMREELVRACASDWSGISPAVFGSLFQAVKSPEAQSILQDTTVPKLDSNEKAPFGQKWSRKERPYRSNTTISGNSSSTRTLTKSSSETRRATAVTHLPNSARTNQYTWTYS